MIPLAFNASPWIFSSSNWLLAAIKIENDALNDNWRYGVFRVDIQPDGRGGSAPQT